LGILIDDRAGSKHYQPLITGSELTRLEAGDACWMSWDNRLIGAEIKRVTDGVNCMFSGRLADLQLPRMSEVYDFRYLIVEGIYRADAEGVLERYVGELGKWGSFKDATAGRKRVMYSQFEMWLHSAAHLGGAYLERTAEPQDTARLLMTLEAWWKREEHKSFNVMHMYEGDSAALVRPSVLRRIAAELPLIGWERSAAVVERFHSVAEMVGASEKDWMEVEGIGKGIAKQVVEALNNAH
jgi:ERCC4-type nuclease